MKNIKRLILGLLSSFLFATGFVHAADKLDPLSEGRAPLAGNTSAPDCSQLCDIVDRNA